MGNLWFCAAKWSRKTTSNLLGAPLKFDLIAILYARRICAKSDQVSTNFMSVAAKLDKKLLRAGFPETSEADFLGFARAFFQKSEKSFSLQLTSPDKSQFIITF